MYKKWILNADSVAQAILALKGSLRFPTLTIPIGVGILKRHQKKGWLSALSLAALAHRQALHLVKS